MTLQSAFGKKKKPSLEHLEVGTLPSRQDLAFLMMRATQNAPESQILRWRSSEQVVFTLDVRCHGEQPTWTLSSETDDVSTVIWRVLTTDPEEIFKLLLKKTASIESASDDSSSVTSAPVLEPPRPAAAVDSLIAGKYKLSEKIGAGAMGTVFRADDMAESRQVAVKLLHPHLLQAVKSRKRFETEAQAAFSLKHPNIVAIYDYGFWDETPYMVMELLSGTTLDQYLAEFERIPVDLFFRSFCQTASALHHAHTRAVIHRDVKPKNIIVVPSDGQLSMAKLVDFGIAKILWQGEDQKLTHTGESLGSPCYMSPEQCEGRKLDARSDIYALGCVMYEAICGVRPFEGENTLRTFFLHVNTDPPRLHEVIGDAVPPGLEAIIFKCLAKKPEYRYQTADELRIALEQLRDRTSMTGGQLQPSAGDVENLMATLELLETAGVIDNSKGLYAEVCRLPYGEFRELLKSKWRVEQKTYICARQCIKLIEQGFMGFEDAGIALRFCIDNNMTLEEAMREFA